MPDADPSVLRAPERLAALADSGLLDALPDEAFDRLTRLAARIVGADTAVVTLVDTTRQFFLSRSDHAAAPPRETSLAYSYCQHVVAGAAPLIVTDATTHPLVYDNLATIEDGVRSYAGVPLRAPGGEVLGSFCAFHGTPHAWADAELAALTDLAAAAEDEIRLRAVLRERDRVAARKDKLIAVVSHELRTPLTGILGALKLQVAQRAPGEDGRMVDIALASAERMLRLTNALLDLDQAERGVAISVAPVLVADALATAAQTFIPAAAAAGLTIAVVDAPGVVRADADRLQQVLGNLVGNAVKFSPAGGVITLSSVEHDDAVELRVRDEGRGVPPDQTSRIFEPFAQVELGDRHEKGGAGLGLPICRALVDRMHGRIWVEPAPGRGSVFALRLPRG
jgi:signal transduction histidine kinase